MTIQKVIADNPLNEAHLFINGETVSKLSRELVTSVDEVIDHNGPTTNADVIITYPAVPGKKNRIRAVAWKYTGNSGPESVNGALTIKDDTSLVLVADVDNPGYGLFEPATPIENSVANTSLTIKLFNGAVSPSPVIGELYVYGHELIT